MPRYNGGFIGTDGLDAPDPPTGVSASAGGASIEVSFTAPTDTGTSAITGYVAQASTDGTNYSAGSATGTSSPITISSLTNGTAYTAKVWAINAYGTSAPSDASSSATPIAPRAVVFLGQANDGTGNKAGIDFFDISSTGNTSDFGDITGNIRVAMGSAGGSSSRGIWAGGTVSGLGAVDVMDYVTIQTTGNTTDFGNLVEAKSGCSSLSNDTRYITGGGSQSPADRIQYVTIATTGNATDFGDLTKNKAEFFSTANSTRGLWFTKGSGNNNEIEYVTIATTGNGTDFGDMTVSCESAAALASSTRALHGGGSGDLVDIGYVTIASTGNATDFGDLTVGRTRMDGTSSSTRGVFCGGLASPGGVIDYVTIASTGDATDFGDMSYATQFTSATSAAHGGL
jgi:hypothetical protein